MQWSFSALAAPLLHINHFWSRLRSAISPTCKNVGLSQKLTIEELTQCYSIPSPTTLSVWSHTYFMQKRSYYSAPSWDAFCPLWLKIHFLYFPGLPFLGLAYSSYFCLNPLLSREEKKVKVLVTQSCPTLCNPMDCNPPGCSVHGILQAIMLEWIAIPFSNRSPLGHKLSDGDGIAPSSYLEPHWFSHPPISFTRKAEQNFSSHFPSPFITSRVLITWK